MGLCKCPKRKVTNLFCYVHKVNVCEHCMVEQHPRCVVHSYVNWLEDSDFDPTCSLCSNSLDQGEVIRLVCYDLYHVTCLDKYASSIANGVTVVCPKCQEPLIPPPNLVSPVADVVRRCFSQFSWAAGLLPPPITTAHSMTLDELDTSIESTSLDLSQQQSYSGQQDHVINFYTSQSDPVNRGHKPVGIHEEQSPPVADSDDDKYKRKGTMERISRTIRNYQTQSNTDDGSFLVRRYWFFAVLIIFSFLSLIVLMTRVGRSIADNDPLLDIRANPNIITNDG
ncbi:zinc finger protein-like 1 homolog [Dysidea avara]|uniref:zinc finger protein-like 1 homolog n=1 Tax=Dysidea avara TaxID=196820 RepID=UPI003324E25B